MSSLENLKTRYAGTPFKVLLINVREPEEDVKKFFAREQIHLQVLLDQDGKVSQNYHVSTHPIKFLIDGQGNMLAMGLGYRDWNSAEIDNLVHSLIKNAAKTPKT